MQAFLSACAVLVFVSYLLWQWQRSSRRVQQFAAERTELLDVLQEQGWAVDRHPAGAEAFPEFLTARRAGPTSRLARATRGDTSLEWWEAWAANLGSPVRQAGVLHLVRIAAPGVPDVLMTRIPGPFEAVVSRDGEQVGRLRPGAIALMPQVFKGRARHGFRMLVAGNPPTPLSTRYEWVLAALRDELPGTTHEVT